MLDNSEIECRWLRLHYILKYITNAYGNLQKA